MGCHAGLREYRAGNGLHRIRSAGIERELQHLGVAVNLLLEQVEDYEGDTGSSFEVMRRISRAVSDAIASKSFPLVLSGNCIASAAVACGLQIQNLALIYFDAHDYLDSPDVKWTRLDERSYSPALVQLSLDVLDISYGKVSDYPPPGGLFESNLISCMEIVPQMVTPGSLAVCSFDPDAGDGDRMAQIGTRAILTCVKALLSEGELSKNLKYFTALHYVFHRERVLLDVSLYSTLALFYVRLFLCNLI
ncbi:uncharacterized protein ANIA_03965 [Aspergillus nidulans FGSC A4]|uniref:Hypothetical arginase family protein (Eurofung) n=1 Tax=Emericella nidulans (strain FGSC A4 / ATCC 38163 / CBS 112.46 / NRRL 194 / M139) TaxID=227321 RepID=C8V5Y3_EMENI|nr:hypothetical protein [Aspergillus nidulans FGSC A4]CBF74993.1 TPA: hypothetical arginase family protein (Eurofung) [Aspergillus nidulans FGSC A4]